MRIKIPINNTVEMIVVDLYVNVQCKLMPLLPVEKTEAKVALAQIESKINMILYDAVHKAKEELESLSE